MDTTDAGRRSIRGDKETGTQAGNARPGQSGEGAGSALEQLIQQERRRDAHLPREDTVAGGPADPRREQGP